VDDLTHLRAQTKFLFQLLGGVILFSLGAVLPLTPGTRAMSSSRCSGSLPSPTRSICSTVSTASPRASARSPHFFWASRSRTRALAARVGRVVADGATLGFLRYNFHPASIFMGDAGSLFIGSVLAGLVVSSRVRAPRDWCR